MDRNNNGLSGKAFFYCRNVVKRNFEWKYDCRKIKKNVSSGYHVQYAENHLEKAKDVFMKVMKILWIYIAQWKEK